MSSSTTSSLDLRKVEVLIYQNIVEKKVQVPNPFQPEVILHSNINSNINTPMYSDRVRQELQVVNSLTKPSVHSAIEGSTTSERRSTFDWRMQLLDYLFIIRDRRGVARLLDQAPNLLWSLAATQVLIKQYFKDDLAYLDVMHDPEFGGSDKLIISIETILDVDDALPTFDRLEEAWWSASSPQARNKIYLNIEYK